MEDGQKYQVQQYLKQARNIIDSQLYALNNDEDYPMQVDLAELQKVEETINKLNELLKTEV